jgi:hypothetical protein
MDNHKNIEAKIKDEYGLSTYDFFDECVLDGMSVKEIAMTLGCSVSNLRRIARKYKFSFYRPEALPLFIDSSNFKSKKLNLDNFLSKSWITT